MKTKNFVILIIVLLVLLAGVYFGYKGINLYIYDMSTRLWTAESYDNFINGLNIKNTIEINKVITSEDDYLSFNNVKVKNYFKDFRKIEATESNDELVRYALYNENNEVIATFSIRIMDTYIDRIKAKDEDSKVDDELFNNEDRTTFFKNHNIEDDIDLFKFLKTKKDIKSNVFTSVKKMKENYAYIYFATMGLPTARSITLIDGDYKGYIFNLSDARECNILYKDKRYEFTFSKLNYFTDDYINEILNTVVIN